MAMSARLRELLDDSGVPFHVTAHARAYTAQETAEKAHVHGRDLVKAVMVVADNDHVMLAVPATAKVDLAAARQVLHATSIRLADEPEFVHDFPDCEPGGMPPIGRAYGMRMLADDAIRRERVIAFNAGNHVEVVQMNREDWESLARPEWGRITSA